MGTRGYPQVVLDGMAVGITALNWQVFSGDDEGNFHNLPFGICRTFVRIVPPTFSCRAALANVTALMVQPPHRRL